MLASMIDNKISVLQGVVKIVLSETLMNVKNLVYSDSVAIGYWHQTFKRDISFSFCASSLNLYNVHNCT